MSDVGTAGPAFFGFAGASMALILANIGAAYGTAKSGVGVAAMGAMRPGAVMRNIIPVVMAGVIGIYGLIVAVLLSSSIASYAPSGGTNTYTWNKGFVHLASGLCVGLSGIGAGYAIGIAGDRGARAAGQQPKTFVGFVLILIFGEALALYGLIVGLILSQS